MFCKDNIILENYKLIFASNNSIITLIKIAVFSMNICVENDSVFYMEKNCFVNKTSDMYVTIKGTIITDKW